MSRINDVRSGGPPRGRAGDNGHLRPRRSSYWGRLASHLYWSFRHRGPTGTALTCLAHPLLVVGIDLERRAWYCRYIHSRFDRIHRVETNSPVPVGELGIAAAQQREAVGYAPTSSVEIGRLLASLGLPYERYTFVDFGAGKGRALFLAAEFPFKRIIGVEISRQLAEVAERNIGSYVGRRQRCRDLQIVCADARDFRLPPEPLVLYFYNPFGGELMQEVLDNTSASLRAHPRPIILIYHEPTQRQRLEACDWLRGVDLGFDERRWAVYEAVSIDLAAAPASR